jgi:integrase
VLQPDEWAFPARYRKPGMLMHSTAPRKPLATCLTAAGITQRFTPHGCRHTYNNLMRQVEHEGFVLRAMTGHGSEALTDRYSHVPAGDEQKALGAMVQLVASTRSPRDGGPCGGRRSRGASAADQKR